MVEGISGSGAARSRTMNAAPSRQAQRREQAEDRHRRPRIVDAAHAERQHERRARRHDEAGAEEVELGAAARAAAAGAAASRHDAMAMTPSGMFIQKITDQCRYSAMKPPSTGPQRAGAGVGDREVSVVLAAIFGAATSPRITMPVEVSPPPPRAVQHAAEDQHEYVGCERADDRAASCRARSRSSA